MYTFHMMQAILKHLSISSERRISAQGRSTVSDSQLEQLQHRAVACDAMKETSDKMYGWCR
jgi:hypothetical protein